MHGHGLSEQCGLLSKARSPAKPNRRNAKDEKPSLRNNGAYFGDFRFLIFAWGFGSPPSRIASRNRRITNQLAL